MENITFGYVRVSTKDQNEERQLVKMRELGIEEVNTFIDKASGKNLDRPQYQTMRSRIRKGDLIYLDALDRLGRNYDDIISEWKYITRTIGADIIVLENESLFDSRKFKAQGDMGKLMEDQFLSMLAYVAEQERKKNKVRQAEGIAVARAQGKHLGRPQINLSTLSKYQYDVLAKNFPKWKAKEITAVSFMEMLDLKRNTFYKIAKEYEQLTEAN